MAEFPEGGMGGLRAFGFGFTHCTRELDWPEHDRGTHTRAEKAGKIVARCLVFPALYQVGRKYWKARPWASEQTRVHTLDTTDPTDKKRLRQANYGALLAGALTTSSAYRNPQYQFNEAIGTSAPVLLQKLRGVLGGRDSEFTEALDRASTDKNPAAAAQLTEFIEDVEGFSQNPWLLAATLLYLFDQDTGQANQELLDCIVANVDNIRDRAMAPQSEPVREDLEAFQRGDLTIAQMVEKLDSPLVCRAIDFAIRLPGEQCDRSR